MSDSENEPETVRRSTRRCGESAKTKGRNAALERLKNARATGKAYQPQLEVENVYEEVDEAEYEQVVSKRRDDNFVVDDDGMGYVDTGVDFEDDYEDEYEPTSSKKSDKPSKKDKKEKKEKKKGRMDAFLSAAGGNSKKSNVDEAKVKAEMDNDADLQDILDGLAGEPEDEVEAPVRTKVNPFKRGRIEESSESLAPRPIVKKAKTLMVQKKLPLKVASPVRPEEQDDDDDDEDYGVPEPDFELPPSPVPVKQEKVPEPAIEQKVHEIKMEVGDDEDNDDESTSRMREVENSLAKFRVMEEEWQNNQDDQDEVKVEVNTGTEAFYVTRDDQKAIRMYWIDAYEDVHKANGTVYLFGKVRTSEKNWESCAVTVKNICRKVYFMPRASNLSNDGEVTGADLHKEIGEILRKKFHTPEFKCKMTEKELIRDEAFGQNGGTKTPLMEVLYPADKGKLPSDLHGDTFSHIFNTSVSPLERLLIEKKFMGPGWIELFNYTDPRAKTSNCKYEFEVDMEKMKNINYLDAQELEDIKNETPPTIRLLSLNVITTLNEKKEHEICMISTLFNSRTDLEHPSENHKNFKPRCLVTKPSGGSLPYDIQKRLESSKIGKHVRTVPNEKALLTLFLAEINDIEPDMIVGHDLAATISLLVSRLEKLKLPSWSRISRLKRSIAIGKIGHSKSGQWELTAGRMMLDSKLAAMELIKSRSFDLTELALKILGESRQEIYANEIRNLYSESNDLISLINRSWNDLFLSIRIVVRLNALPLYMQISKIVGGIASRTMMGGRAERNEYLLLHAFEKADLIAPDKYSAFDKKKKEKEHLEDSGEGGDEKKSNKAQYAGGLVLEPKKGLYETLILLLDFNSLYPSIIQEYNICYTTLEYSKDSDAQLSVPQSADVEGVLPREIRKLVECRRDVKGLMKSEKNEAKKKQLDIRQLALKLTANSMYGCLGFQFSRFYAKPLAALVTAKGREILMHSKDLVEKLGYSVVYGDTDSIMINTNSMDLAVAKKLGMEIKKAVNKCHRLLELDLDGVFKRMLLLKKKKYAAVTINPDTKAETQELKGLDIVRRDWSQLAKETGTEVVNKILDSSLTRDEMVSSISDLLKNIREKLDAGAVPLEMFQISKQLTRNPDQYADTKAQSHAAVAQRLNKSGKFHLRHNDIVEYVICEDGTENPATQRAYHRTEMVDNKVLKIDLQYYLAQQIHPVVSRLCEPIEETDAVRIAEDLGLDPTNYKRAAAAHASQRAAEEDCAWQQENYDLCEGVIVVCPHTGCGQTNIIRETFDTVTDANCPRALLTKCGKCEKSWTTDKFMAVISNQVDRQMNDFVARHHMAAFKCDEPTCEFKTRVQTMKWCREGLECMKCSSGVLRREYTSKQLFDQQMFFQQILDGKAAISKLTKQQERALDPVDRSALNGPIDELAVLITEKYLERNAYNRVDLAYLFAPMMHI